MQPQDILLAIEGYSGAVLQGKYHHTRGTDNLICHQVEGLLPCRDADRKRRSRGNLYELTLSSSWTGPKMFCLFVSTIAPHNIISSSM